jgi:hypothetical protein
LDKFNLLAGIGVFGTKQMANRQNHLLALAVLLLSALPAQAQEAALDAPVGASGAPQSMQMSQSRVAKSSSMPAATESNYTRNWSRFSQSSSSPKFLRVAPGTKCKGQENVSHYVRPRCVVPGSVPAATQQVHKGPVRRHLAYDVPVAEAGSGKTSSNKPAGLLPGPGHAFVMQQGHVVAVKKPVQPRAMVMGYGSKAGEVTYTPVSSKWHGTAISCYGRYH